MGVFTEDTFTDTNGTLLDAHTGEVGATWTEGVGHGTGAWAILNDRAYPSTGLNQSGRYYASGLPDSADYVITAVFRRVTDSGVHFTAISGRHDPAANTFYYAGVSEYATPNEWTLGKTVAGSSTDLDTYVGDSTVSTDYTVVFSLAVDALAVTIGGVEQLSATDSAITAANRAGVNSFNFIDDAGGWQIASLSAATAAPTTQELRPSADVTTTGWTTTPLWSKIDEATPDGTIITATAS